MKSYKYDNFKATFGIPKGEFIALIAMILIIVMIITGLEIVVQGRWEKWEQECFPKTETEMMIE